MKYGIPNQFWIYILLFSFFSLIGYAQTTVRSYEAITDSLIKELEQPKSQKNKIDILNEISYQFRRTKPEQVLLYAKQAEVAARSIGYVRGEAIALKNIGIGHFKKGSPSDTIIYYYTKSSQLAEKVGDYQTQAACLNNIALVYHNLKEYSLAIDYTFEGIDVFERHSTEDNRTKTLMIANLGELNLEINNYEKAEEYLTKGITIARKNQYTDILGIYLDDLARIKLQQGELDIAKQYLDESTLIQRQSGDYASLAEVLIIEGEYWIEKKDKAAAKKKYEAAYSLAQESQFGESEIRALLGLIQTEEGMKKNILYVNKALEKSENIENIRLKANVLSEATRIYEEIEAYQDAFKNSKAYVGIIDSIHQLDKKLHVERIEENNKKRGEIEVLEVRQQSQLAIILLSLALIGVCIGFLVNSRRSNRALKVANKNALAAAEVKQQFLSTMSHEIRTPMNAVIGFTDILLQAKPRIDQSPYLQNLKASSEYLMDLLNDVLDYSKLEANKVVIEKTPFNLEKHLHSIIEIFRISNQNKELSIQLNFQVPLQHQVLGDPTRLKQILANLIGNAVKFTPKGSVFLKVTLIEKIEDKMLIRFEVKDTGIGIPKDKQKLIFNSFSQASDTTTREFGGSGLGLAITKELIELQGGQINLQSVANEGSVFSFEFLFPVTNKSLSEKVSPLSKGLDTEVLKGIKILLAEDNLFNQKVVIKILERYGIELFVVQNGKKAVEQAIKYDFDLILMDLHMPEMDGFEAIQHIRASKLNVPIIALTAASTEEFRKYPSLSDVDYVSKPFKSSQLIEMIIKNLQPPASFYSER